MISDKDKYNLFFAESQEAVDERNREFYGRFTYPWPPLTFPSVADPQCATVFLNQELGDWTHSRVPRAPKIWVAGCGTNQAIFTALKFPDAEVLGTDISAQSLAVCRNSASQLGIENLRLEEQSINSVCFREEFDYVICTGVIHHNADPSIPLARLAAALRTCGILEVMVYNYYHRVLTTAYQKAVRHLFSGDEAADLDAELSVTKELIERFPFRNSMGEYLRTLKGEPEAMIADTLLQPVEHSYTVESLGELLAGAGLEFWLPCLNQFDQAAGRLTWNMDCDNERVARRYEALPDIERWQVSNLLMAEKSPMLWFYAQKEGSGIRRKSEQEVCREFLWTRFEKYCTILNNYFGGDKTYKLVPTPIPHPSPRLPADDLSRSVFKAASPEKTLADVFRELNVEPTFNLVNRVRIQLTTPLFPYLKALAQA